MIRVIICNAKIQWDYYFAKIFASKPLGSYITSVIGVFLGVDRDMVRQLNATATS